MESYYVKLQIILNQDCNPGLSAYEKVPGEKQAIKMKDLFNTLPSQTTEANKVLLVVGKSTLMQYMAFRWAKGELWKDRFDSVYRVLLKTLLNETWKRGDDSVALEDQKLKHLVHYHLCASLSKEERKKYLEEIVGFNSEGVNKDKILLLLDGYDEIAHLSTSQKIPNFSNNSI